MSGRVKIAGVTLMLAACGAWWFWRGDERASGIGRSAEPQSAVAMNDFHRLSAPVIAAAPTAAKVAEAVGGRLEPNSQALFDHVEQIIPRQLHEEAGRCYHGGLKQDQHLDMSFRVHVEDGMVSISNLKVDDDTLANPGLARCIEDKVLAARFRDDQMPDWDADGDLFISGDTLKRYLASADDE